MMCTGSCRSSRHVEREVENVGESIRRTPWYPFTLPSSVFRRATPVVMQKEGRRECNAKRWSAKMKRRNEYEERSDDGMWSGKLQR